MGVHFDFVVKITQQFKARGHRNVTLRHRTTIMITTDRELSLKGDCIAVVASELGLSHLRSELKEAIRSPDANIILKLAAEEKSIEVHGRGHPDLSLEDTADMVARKSGYTGPRTLMIHADKASVDVPREFVELLRGSPQVDVTITAIL